ncbi:MAG: alpha-ribazole phosphatase [Acidimicrobiaceae bacterium]|nr:alpha-ribazole phosphatase [Acidimicrobiaceae bacterium]
MIILARHGQTSANAGGLLLGRADLPLTEVGRRQAQALAGAVTSAHRVISSPLRRATETAAAFGLPVEVDERWVEVDYGEYDQRPLGSVPEEIWRMWRADPEYRPPGGESFAAVAERVREACDGLMGEASTSDIVVVSHVSPIKEAVAWALGVSGQIAWRMHLNVAAISRLGCGPRGTSLLSFNETSHLLAVATSGTA